MKQELNKSIKKIVSYNKFLNNKPIAMGTKLTLDDFMKQSEGYEALKNRFDSLQEILNYIDKKVNELLEKKPTLTPDEQNLLDFHDMKVNELLKLFTTEEEKLLDLQKMLEEEEVSTLLTKLQNGFRTLNDTFTDKTRFRMVTQSEVQQTLNDLINTQELWF